MNEQVIPCVIIYLLTLVTYTHAQYSTIAKYPEQIANVLCLKTNSLTGEKERVQYDHNFHSSDRKKMK